MGVEHIDRIVGSDLEPMGQGSGIGAIDRVKDQWWQCKVIDQVHPLGDVNLHLVIAVNLHEHGHISLMERLGERVHKRIGVREHET